MSKNTMNVEHMTKRAISEEIKTLEMLLNNDEITPAEAIRLAELWVALKRIEHVKSGLSMWE